jgi:hypothetical protein
VIRIVFGLLLIVVLSFVRRLAGVEQMNASDAGERAADFIACMDGLALAHVVAAAAGQDALARSVTRVVVGPLG